MVYTSRHSSPAHKPSLHLPLLSAFLIPVCPSFLLVLSFSSPPSFGFSPSSNFSPLPLLLSVPPPPPPLAPSLLPLAPPLLPQALQSMFQLVMQEGWTDLMSELVCHRSYWLPIMVYVVLLHLFASLVRLHPSSPSLPLSPLSPLSPSPSLSPTPLFLCF